MSTLLLSTGPMPRSRDRYDRLSRALHWIFAAVILYTMFAGYALHIIDNRAARHVVSTLNMSLATVLIVLLPIRYFWSVLRCDPDPIASIPARQRAIAHAVHSLIYVLVALVLLSGFVMVPDGYWLFGTWYIHTPFSEGAMTQHWFVVHRIACRSLAVLVAMHIGAALKHHFVSKNDVLKRML